MIYFRATNKWDDPDYDPCGNETYAVLEINNIQIPLCEECTNELISDIDKFKGTIFCHKCKYFENTEYDRYICSKHSRDAYRMETCKDAERKE